MLVRAQWVVVAVIAAVSLPLRAWPQPKGGHQTLLTGRVYDEARRPIAGVEVILNRKEVRAVTNGAGLFSLPLAPLDSTIGFRRIGYRPMLLVLHPLPPAGDTILVQLLTSQVELPELIVSAPPSKPLRYAGTTKYDDVFLRQKVGLGTLLTREAITLRFGVSTAQLMEGIPGVHYFDGPPKRLRFARCPEPGGVTVYIDGFRQVARAGFEESPEVATLSRIHPSEIEMIEVFRGASEIPGVFHWDGCAVVAVWTRWNR